jgi:hypothetical protein
MESGQEQPKDQPGIEAKDNLGELNAPRVEFFILADYAEAVNGKLYLMGGGWEQIFVDDFGKPVEISFAVGVLVPWHATNVRHTIQFAIEDMDRKRPVDFKLEAGFVAGRPPVVAEEMEPQVIKLAVQRVPVKFNEPGKYQAVVRIVGGDEKRTQFRLLALPTAPQPFTGR